MAEGLGSLEEASGGTEASRRSIEEHRGSIREPSEESEGPRRSIEGPRESVKEPRGESEGSRRSIGEPRWSVEETRASKEGPRRSIEERREGSRETRRSIEERRGESEGPRRSTEATRKSMEEPRGRTEEPREGIESRKSMEEARAEVYSDRLYEGGLDDLPEVPAVINSTGQITMIEMPDRAPPSPQKSCSTLPDEIDLVSEVDPSALWAILMALVLPSAIVCLLLSDIGFGVDIYNSLHEFEDLSNLSVSGLAGLCVLLFLCDVQRWHVWPKLVAGTAGWALFVASGLLRGTAYPQGPLIVGLLHIPILLALIRYLLCIRVYSGVFYRTMYYLSLILGFLILAAWVGWIAIEAWDGQHFWDEEERERISLELDDLHKELRVDYNLHCVRAAAGEGTLSDDPKENERLYDDCSTTLTTAYIVYVTPMIVAFTLIILAIFCKLRASNDSSARTEAFSHSHETEASLKTFVVFTSLLVMCFWIASSIAGSSSSMSGAVMGFAGAGSLVLFIWAFMAFGKARLLEVAHKSPLVASLLDMASSDWARAFFICIVNVGLLVAVLLDFLRQCVRSLWWTNRPLEERGMVSHGMRAFLERIRGWHWGSVLKKICLLCLLYYCLWVGVAKVTYVFLSWLNERLETMSLAAVVGIIYIIGIIMFLLPPVPGVPVYVTAGIVISARSYCNDEGDESCIGFWQGTVLAVIIGYILKLNAVVMQQKIIGEQLGKSIRIQKFVGVDKAGIRAIEKILRVPGYSMPKIAILCGGPDWPTSVLTGIMKLSVFQMVLGTMPCIFLIIPCVLSGALLNRTGEGAVWGALASTVLAVAGLIQAAAMVFAAYILQDTLQKHHDELTAYRPEHEAVAELTRQEAMRNATISRLTEWAALPTLSKINLLLAASSLLMSCVLAGFFSTSCFHPFELTNRISEDLSEGGLDGSVWNLLKRAGWLSLGLFAAGWALLEVHNAWVSYIVKKEMKRLIDLGHNPRDYTVAGERRIRESDASIERRLERSSSVQYRMEVFKEASKMAEPDDEPGPGEYGPLPGSGVGQQQLSQHANPPTARVFGRNTRSWSQMWISKHHLGELVGKDTPGAGTYEPSTTSESVNGKKNSVRFGGARRRTELGYPNDSPGPAYDVRGCIAAKVCNTGSALRRAERYVLDELERAMRANNVGPGDYDILTPGSKLDESFGRSFGVSHRAYDKTCSPGFEKELIGRTSPGPGFMTIDFAKDAKLHSFARSLRPPLHGGGTRVSAPGPGTYGVQEAINMGRLACFESSRRNPPTISFGKPSRKPRIDFKALRIRDEGLRFRARAMLRSSRSEPLL
ncbi:hypothetical protein FOZ61_004819 [Perkinsus olseni]|uniref:Uncharacterized protein n=1 Tax=Perkinsus olseni TaxID=32597 RepID=A0A7J6LJL5_PEROL|nr:hypothetical protein FOZ61_004819 [Perkinsus olseni]